MVLFLMIIMPGPPDLPDRIPERPGGARCLFFNILQNSFVFLQNAGNNSIGMGKPLYNPCACGEILEGTGGVKSN
jgi:hypothetical protein